MANVFLLLLKLLELYRWILLARILCSWLPNANWYNQPLKLLFDLTEPVMGPFRRLIPPIGMIDISPMLLFFILGWLIQILSRMALSGIPVS